MVRGFPSSSGWFAFARLAGSAGHGRPAGNLRPLPGAAVASPLNPVDVPGPVLPPPAGHAGTSGYRPGAAAVVRRPVDGRILICERADHPGSWQFPQGGRQDGESPAETLARELEEELALRPTDYRIVRQVGPYRYVFPPGRYKEGYAGQEHDYFLVDLLAPENRINVATAEPEFRATRWIDPAGFSLAWLAPMKREPYRQVFRDLFEVELPVSALAGSSGAA